MATAIEYGTIAAVISVAIITTVAATHYLRPEDPVKVRYDRINTECAKPTTDGRRREVVWLAEMINIDGKGGYVVCPTR